MILDKNYFVKQPFQPDELNKYLSSARRNLEIARSNQETEVKFHFTYMSLLKAGIYVLAREGYRVKSQVGHHQKTIEAVSKLLNNEDIMIIGNKMRKERNQDLYGFDNLITPEELDEYFKFVEKLCQQLEAVAKSI